MIVIVLAKILSRISKALAPEPTYNAVVIAEALPAPIVPVILTEL